MAKPKKADVLKRYQTELTRSVKWRNDEQFDELWQRMRDLYKGRHYDSVSKSDRMVINRAFKTKNVIAPSVAVNNPKFQVDPRKPDSAATALVVSEVLNYLWRANKYKKQFRLAVDDYLVFGHGWMKVGYKFVKDKPKVKNADVDTEDGGDDTEPGVDDREATAGNVESEHKVKDDRPFAERISPFDIFVDPDCRNLEEARWIAQRVKRPVADVRVDSRYAPRHRVKAMMTARDRWEEGQSDELVTDPNSASKGFVDVWEFYDLREGTVCTFIREYEDGFLIDPDEQPYAFGHPFLMLRNYEVPDEFYPMGELESIEYLQLELNRTRTDMMLHRRTHNRKYLASEEAFTSDGAWEALESDDDNVIVKVNTAAVNIKDAVAVMPSTTIQADQYNMSDLISNDIDDITGVTDFGQANIRRTATEAAMIQDQQNARSSDKLAVIEGFLAEIGERLVQLMQQYMTGEHVARIVGTESEPHWVVYDKDYIAGEFDFSVEAGSTQPSNESFRAQRAMQLMDAMAPFLQMGVADPVAVMRKVLADGFGVKDPSQFIMQQEEAPAEDPMAQQMPPEGMPPEMPMDPMDPMADPMAAESPIAGIPPELVARLNVEPSPALGM